MSKVADYFRGKRVEMSDTELKKLMRFSLNQEVRQLAYGTLVNRKAFNRSRKFR